MTNLWDYHNLYLMTDIFLLADILLTFRHMCLSFYKIDPFHSFTAPGFSWQAALKMCDVNLELVTDPNIHHILEQGIRGGISTISHRHAEADAEHALLYIDANNLYGFAMSQSLPTGNFTLRSGDNFSTSDILSIADDAPRGSIFIVDCNYPSHLHTSHNDYPLAPEKLTVTFDMLSTEQLLILETFERQHLIDTKNNFIGPIKPTPPTYQKLITNLRAKHQYIVHYRNLKFYIRQGLQITHIHKVLSFDQSPWLKPYITFNTTKRSQATSVFEKDFFKLLNNSVFGKTMQKVRKERKLDFVDTVKKAKKFFAQPTFKNFTAFREDLIAIERRKTSIYFNKPIYVGFSILEISKVHMYNFHYEFIKKQYPGENSQLCFTDTDSFIYRLKTRNVYSDMLTHSSYFDFSDYPDTHPCFADMSPNAIKDLQLRNKKVLGKFKDELKGVPMLEFVGLRSKMYSFRTSSKEVKKLKGIKTSVVKRDIHFEHYKSCLESHKRMTAKQTLFKVTKHQVQTVVQSKISLSSYDDKRYLLNNISSLAYGHYEIEQ